MRQRSVVLIPLLILLVAGPTAMALLYYHITKDPTLRPLGITIEELVRTGNSGNPGTVIADVTWSPSPETKTTQKQVSRAIVNAFGAHGVEAHVIFHDADTAGRITVTYRVGANRYGPYPLSRAVQGISAAVSAHKMIPPTPEG